MEKLHVVVDYMDGHYTYKVVDQAGPATIEVPESTVKMWNATTDAYRVMQDQLLLLDNEVVERQHP